MLHNLLHCNKVIFSTKSPVDADRNNSRERSTPLDGGCAKYFYRRITEAVIFAVGLPFTRINERIYSR